MHLVVRLSSTACLLCYGSCGAGAGAAESGLLQIPRNQCSTQQYCGSFGKNGNPMPLKPRQSNFYRSRAAWICRQMACCPSLSPPSAMDCAEASNERPRRSLGAARLAGTIVGCEDRGGAIDYRVGFGLTHPPVLTLAGQAVCACPHNCKAANRPSSSPPAPPPAASCTMPLVHTFSPSLVQGAGCLAARHLGEQGRQPRPWFEAPTPPHEVRAKKCCQSPNGNLSPQNNADFDLEVGTLIFILGLVAAI